ncbi:MAG TPA: Gfo/Idh/MocA family oxidoreductase [Pyrinomonadaceae bacterium]|nr:Gfo/Idh/MocA family oxidoreductase [Pyrinomonadaceae bacterium]
MSQKTIGIGVIGAGFARTTQLPAFRACEGARVVAIASGHRENAERAAREFDIPFVAADWREVVAHADVDLVSVVTPPVTHAEMTLAALAAGKAVLCEKPMAMNSEETGRMRAAAEGACALALVDHELRFLPARRRMREIIMGGEIGRVRHAKFMYRADSRASAKGTWNWWSDAAMGGGALGAIGSHAVDTLHWLLGARASHVTASLATHVAARPDVQTGEARAVTSDDEAVLVLRFADGEVTEGATGLVSISVVEMGRSEHSVEVFGTEGALRVEGAGGLWRAGLGLGKWDKIETEDAPLAAGLRDNEWSRGFTIFAREIVGALREGRTSVEGAASFADGHRTQLVLDAARAAHDGGCRVVVGDEG